MWVDPGRDGWMNRITLAMPYCEDDDDYILREVLLLLFFFFECLSLVDMEYYLFLYIFWYISSLKTAADWLGGRNAAFILL